MFLDFEFFFFFTTKICNISLVLKNNVFVRIAVLEQNKIYEFNLIKYNVKFYTKPILLFLDEILMLRILHQLCKQLFTGFCRVGTFYQFPCSHTLFLVFSFRGVRFCLGNICERFARRDLC